MKSDPAIDKEKHVRLTGQMQKFMRIWKPVYNMYSHGRSQRETEEAVASSDLPPLYSHSGYGPVPIEVPGRVVTLKVVDPLVSPLLHTTNKTVLSTPSVTV